MGYTERRISVNCQARGIDPAPRSSQNEKGPSIQPGPEINLNSDMKAETTWVTRRTIRARLIPGRNSGVFFCLKTGIVKFLPPPSHFSAFLPAMIFIGDFSIFPMYMHFFIRFSHWIPNIPFYPLWDIFKVPYLFYFHTSPERYSWLNFLFFLTISYTQVPACKSHGPAKPVIFSLTKLGN